MKKTWDDVQVERFSNGTFGWVATFRAVDSIGSNEIEVHGKDEFPTINEAREAGEAYVAAQVAKRS